MLVRMPSAILAAIQNDARRTAPLEMCGLLFGAADRVIAYRATHNVAADPEHGFEIDPAALIAAERAMREGGPRLIGYVHSHPAGGTAPSATDAAMAAPDGRLWLIVDGEEAQLWRAGQHGERHDRFTRLSLEQVDGKGQ